MKFYFKKKYINTVLLNILYFIEYFYFFIIKAFKSFIYKLFFKNVRLGFFSQNNKINKAMEPSGSRCELALVVCRYLKEHFDGRTDRTK